MRMHPGSSPGLHAFMGNRLRTFQQTSSMSCMQGPHHTGRALGSHCRCYGSCCKQVYKGESFHVALIGYDRCTVQSPDVRSIRHVGFLGSRGFGGLRPRSRSLGQRRSLEGFDDWGSEVGKCAGSDQRRTGSSGRAVDALVREQDLLVHGLIGMFRTPSPAGKQTNKSGSTVSIMSCMMTAS